MKGQLSRRTLRRCLFVAVIAVTLIGVFATTRPAHALTYTLVFSDEFNNTWVDTSKWNITNIASTVNNELEYYAPDEVWESGGVLVLHSQRRNYGGRSYTSGRVDTQNHFTLQYGEVIWHAMAPKGKGIWPALWLVQYQCPPATPCNTWPPEIDVMELKGSNPYTNYMTNWWGLYPNQQYNTQTYSGPDFSQWHEYHLVWDPSQIEWFVDGTLVKRVTSNIPNQPMQIIMNVAVGGVFDGNPDGSTVFPTYMFIDWIHVYRWQ